MKKTVLLIEDDLAFVGLLREAFERHGFSVLSEAEGPRGLETFLEHPVDLVIIDVLIPKLQGFDLLAHLRATPKGKDVAVIMMSAVYRSLTYRTEMMSRHRIAEYFDKPVDLDDLMSVVRRLFAASSQKREDQEEPTHDGTELIEEVESDDLGASPVDGRDASPVDGRDASPVDGRDASPVDGRDASPVGGRATSPVDAPANASVDRSAPASNENALRAPRVLEDVLKEKAKAYSESEEKTTVDLALSPMLRRQARARLERELKEQMIRDTAPSNASQRPLTSSQNFIRVQEINARVLRVLEERYSHRSAQNFYSLLGIGRQASGPDIESAYERRAAEHDPDQTLPVPSTAAVRQVGEKLYSLFVRAHATLMNPAARWAYDREIGELGPEPSISALEAECAFEEGMRAAARADWPSAKSAFREAIERQPREGMYLAYYAWALLTDGPAESGGLQDVLDLLDRARDLSPDSEDIYIFRAFAQERQGQHEAARENFEQALRLNPDSVRALAGLRALAPPPTRKSGLFSRFTG